MAEVQVSQTEVLELNGIRHGVVGVMLLQAVSFLSIAPIWLFSCIALFIALVALPGLVGKRLLNVIVLSASVIVFFLDYRLDYSVEMAAVFLLLVGCMKSLELRSQRDVLIFVYVMLYLSAVSMLFEQGIMHVVLQFCSLLFCLALLMRINDSVIGSVRSQIGRVLKIVSLAFPLAICLFMFFPRIAPLWSMPIKTSSAQTGLSETLRPGAIADLTQSAETAFRATFFGLQPERETLYWRALVLDRFDDDAWSRDREALLVERGRAGIASVQAQKIYQPQSLSTPYYDVILEPHNNRWALALAGSESASGNVFSIGMGVNEFNYSLNSPTPYRMKIDGVASSYEGTAIASLPDVSRKVSSSFQDVQLPANGNPRARDLVTRFLSDGTTEIELISKILDFYASEGFAYTLKPPLLEQDTVDGFLFDTKRGFCEHYASSMAFLLREAGIPSRIVLGYQGGEFNESAGHWTIRQYDAHSWVEAYVQGHGWLRIDPTAYVAPDRLSFGLAAAVQAEGTFLQDNYLASIGYRVGALRWLIEQGDAINYRWQRFVLGYGEADQKKLLQSMLGEFGWRHLVYLLIGILSVLSAATMLYLYLGQYSRSLTRVERRYLRCLLVLRVFRVERLRGETPINFYKRVSDALPTYIKKYLAVRTRELHKKLYNADLSLE